MKERFPRKERCTWRIQGLNFGNRQGARWMFSLMALWNTTVEDFEWGQLFELFTME